MVKKYNELTFTDDFMFCKILENDAPLTIRLVEMILGKKIKSIKNLKSQHELNDWSDARGVRFDVYFEDDDLNVYDVEMQTYSDKNLLMRSRYYHSMMAVESLNKNMSYEQMINSYVIFICTFDPFKLALPVYTAVTRFSELPEYELHDGAITKYLNCTSASEEISSDLRAFFNYLIDEKPSSDLTNAIEDDLLRAKNQQKWRKAYMTLYEMKEIERAEGRAEGLAEGMAIGMAKGKAEGKVEGRAEALKLLMNKFGYSFEDACKALGLNAEEQKQVKELLA